MVILQAAGGYDTRFGVNGFLKRDFRPTATTYNHNDYVHMLNRALQAEKRLEATYAVSCRCFPSDHFVHQICDAHQQSQTDLIALVVANHGIPEESPALNVGFHKNFVSVCCSIGHPLSYKASFTTLQKLEQRQHKLVSNLIPKAPSRDLVRLNQIENRLNAHIEKFGKLHLPAAT